MSPSPDARAATEAMRELGRRTTAAGALAVAFVSLLQHTPLWLACARGVATLLVLGYGTRFGTWALGRALDFDRAARVSKEEAKP